MDYKKWLIAIGIIFLIATIFYSINRNYRSAHLQLMSTNSELQEPHSVSSSQGNSKIIHKAAVSTITGHVRSKSDIQSIFPIRSNSHPIEHGLVLAIPVDKFDSLLDEAETINWHDNIHRVAARIGERLFDEYVDDSESLSPGGDFSLQLLPDNYLLCIANIGRSEPNSFPVKIVGCVEATLREDEVATINIDLGEAGVTTSNQK